MNQRSLSAVVACVLMLSACKQTAPPSDSPNVSPWVAPEVADQLDAHGRFQLPCPRGKWSG